MIELTPLEVAKKLERLLFFWKESGTDDSVSQGYISAVKLAASLCRKVAAGKYKQVVHGEWLNFYNNFSTAECSECGEVYEVSPDEKPSEDYFNAFKQFYKFCPSCGAKMGDDNHETR